MINLSDKQKEIAQQSLDKSIQVLASAGAGKTRVLTDRIRYILEHTKKEGVIAITFTNKAADEMKERLKNSNSAFNRCWIATIHSVAQRILEQYAHTVGLPSSLSIYDREQDQTTLFLQSLSNGGFSVQDLIKSSDYININNERSKNKIIQRYRNIFSRIKKNLLTEKAVKEEYGNRMWSLFKNYQEELINSGGIDFDDILLYAHKILIEQPWCAKIYSAKYKYICVDEAQDLNKIQYEFIKALCAGGVKSVMMAGDPNQMIYGFNGSKTKFLCQQFKDDFSPLQFDLKKNYRSSQEVVRLAKLLKPGSQTESQLALKGKQEICSFDNEEKEANWIYQKITAILKEQKNSDIEGSISLDNIVVIARNRFIFKTLETVLKENNIQYVLKKSQASSEPISCFGKILNLAIRLKLNPKDWISRKKLYELLNVPYKESSITLKEIANHIDISGFGGLKKDTLMGIEGLNIDNPKMLKLFKIIEDKLNLLKEDNKKEQELELEYSFQDFKEFKEYWNLFKQKKSETSLLALKNSIALGELTAVDAAANTPVLTLSTVHNMKGLEKDIVFLIGMCEGVFPDYRAKNIQDKLEEEKNNAFVAITRAKRWIYISYPRYREMPWGDQKSQKESRFVTMINNGLHPNIDSKKPKWENGKKVM